VTRPTLVVADDHGIVRDALGSLLAKDYDVVATATNGHELVDAVLHHRPDVVIADIDMPGLSGVEALAQLRARQIAVKVVFLTMHDDPGLAADVLRAGGSGYVLKHSASVELHDAIEQALSGGRYLTPRVSSGVVDALVRNAVPEPSLTHRQLEVLRLLVEGKRMKEIARELDLSTRTVENYKYEMMDTLGLHSTAELVRYALDHGLLKR
jgi:DNA-binding NarL/FixJ family response regulator